MQSLLEVGSTIFTFCENLRESEALMNWEVRDDGIWATVAYVNVARPSWGYQQEFSFPNSSNDGKFNKETKKPSV